jgi:predicted transcriptional regulator
MRRQCALRRRRRSHATSFTRRGGKLLLYQGPGADSPIRVTATHRLTVTKYFVNTAAMPSKKVRPTRLELTILEVLWQAGPRSVREIMTILNTSRPTGYTTVLKMLQIMTEKGLVERDETVRPQIYRAKSSQEQTQRQMLSDLVQRVYGGSVKTLVMHALGTSKPSAKELRDIEALLDRVKGGER